MGGVDDMAAWTRIVWDMSLAMAVNGTEHCHIPMNPMDIHCDLKQTTKIDSAQRWVDFLFLLKIDLLEHSHFSERKVYKPLEKM
jgi:hypothetical protein